MYNIETVAALIIDLQKANYDAKHFAINGQQGIEVMLKAGMYFFPLWELNENLSLARQHKMEEIVANRKPGYIAYRV